jgi:alpha-L-fucosidase
MKSILSFILIICGLAMSAQNNLPPEPYGVVPSERQLKWHETERYCFLHFTVNTFTDLEWGLGG